MHYTTLGLGYEQISLGATARALAPAVVQDSGAPVVNSWATIHAAAEAAAGIDLPAMPGYCVIQAADGDIRYRTDGTNPTASVGMELFEGTSIVLSTELHLVRLIAVTGTVEVNISYYVEI